MTVMRIMIMIPYGIFSYYTVHDYQINSLPHTNNTLMSLSSEMGSKEGLPSFS